MRRRCVSVCVWVGGVACLRAWLSHVVQACAWDDNVQAWRLSFFERPGFGRAAGLWTVQGTDEPLTREMDL